MDSLWTKVDLPSMIHWTSIHSTFGKLTWPHQNLFANMDGWVK